MTHNWILPALLSSCFATPLFAQAVRPGARPAAAPAVATPASQLCKLKSVKADAVQTPRIDVQITGSSSPAAKLDWLRVRAEYETSEVWTDEVTVSYYVLLKAKRREDVGPNGKQLNLFRGSVTYLNVPKGKHYSDMFLHPDTFARFAGADKTAIDRAAVQISINGQVVQEMSDPSDNKRWWEQHAPMAQTLLNHDQTPFGLGNLDDHRQIKPDNR